MSFRNDQIPSKWVAVTPSDSTVVNFVGLMVTATGDVSWKGSQGDTASVFAAAPVGMIIPGVVSYVMAATTATVLGAVA